MMYKNDGNGVFQMCMSTGGKQKMDDREGPSSLDLESIEDMQVAEQTLENLLDHAARTERAHDEVEEVLAAILGAWVCVKRARTRAGY